jgi:hypothetical protein
VLRLHVEPRFQPAVRLHDELRVHVELRFQAAARFPVFVRLRIRTLLGG